MNCNGEDCYLMSKEAVFIILQHAQAEKLMQWTLESIEKMDLEHYLQGIKGKLKERSSEVFISSFSYLDHYLIIARLCKEGKQIADMTLLKEVWINAVAELSRHVFEFFPTE